MSGTRLGAVVAALGLFTSIQGSLADGLPSAQYGGYKDAYGPVYNWTGVYGGLHAGYLDGTQDLKFPGPGGNLSIDFDGAAVGGQLGIQYHFPSNIVAGAEVSYTGSGTSHGKKACLNSAFTCGGNAKNEVQVVGRLGYAVGRFLPYVKGGYANVSFNNSAVPVSPLYDDAKRHDGWVAGGGLEFAVTDSLILGVDYSHIEVDAETYAPSIGEFRRRIDGDIDMIAGRVSFKLGPTAASSLK
jgi:outer membrane immunogenic protein